MMRVDYKAFGKRLREYRLARHLTQEQLGELVGVSYQHIGMLERGKRSPSMEMLISLCYALVLRRALLVTPRAFRVTFQNLLNMQKAARFMQRAAFSFMRFFTPFQASDCRSSPPFHRRDRTVPCSPSL